MRPKQANLKVDVLLVTLIEKRVAKVVEMYSNIETDILKILKTAHI